MRWIKIVFAVVAFLFVVYSGVMYFFADESKEFTVEKEVDFPIEKVFAQFNNFQNFTRWNNYFSNSKTLSLSYYQPYEGIGSSMSFYDSKSKRNGEMTIRYSNLNRTIKYHLFEGNKSNPTQIDISFRAISPDKTKITWFVHTSKLPLLMRSANFWTEDVFVDNLSKSMTNLHNVLGNKVDKDNMLAEIKYDSIMIEQLEEQVILGINVSTSNKTKDILHRNVVLNYNKTYNFVTTDLGKRDDEIGFPILITNPSNFKDKEVSYFLGIPLSKKVGISDNNFSFRSLPASKAYVMYYKGNYNQRSEPISKLLQSVKKDSMRYGDLQQVFIEAPQENSDVNLKFVLPVTR